jgi:uncharacterized protein (DUF1778 family)
MPVTSPARKDRVELLGSREQKRITLSARDSLRVLDLLAHAPKPTAALRAAAKRRAERISS